MTAVTIESLVNVPARQGGRVQYEPGVPLVGVTFADGAASVSADDGAPAGLRVLLVEPATAARSLATLVLRATAGWEVLDASAPLAFADHLAGGAFDLLVVNSAPGWAAASDIAAAARRRAPGCLSLLFGPEDAGALASACRSAGMDGWLAQDPQGFLELPERLRALWNARREGAPTAMSAALAAGLPLGWFTLGADGTLRYTNDACRQVLGAGPGAVVAGTRLEDWLDAPSASTWDLLRQRGTGSAIVGLRRPHGPATSARLRIVPAAQDHEATAWEGCLEPLTDAAGDAGRTRQTLADVAYALAHDLQEPLRHARQFAGLLREHLGGRLDPEGERLLARVTDSVGRVQVLNDGVIEYLLAGSAAAGTRVDLRAAVDTAVAALADSIDESGATITCGPLPAVSGDAARLASVFQNLIGNSLRYRGPEPPTIDISARREPGGWTVAVSDNGIGIEPRDHERIFGMFQRLHRDTERGGNGIGLALCRRILESIGGRIAVESTAGRGATFLLRFPDSEPRGAAPAGTGRAPDDCGGRLR